MGNTLRKMFHSEPQQDSNVSLPGIGCIFEDPRSPSNGIDRTPIVLEKKPYLETDLDALTPPRHPRVCLLKKQLDPRSPSSIIDRTPIYLSKTDIDSNFYDSPVSFYSRFEGDVDSTLSIPSPQAEPSVNVSDFEPEEDDELRNLVEQLRTSDLESHSPTTERAPISEKISAQERFDLSDKSDKLTGKQISTELINEIIESFKECQDILQAQAESAPKPNISVKKLSLSSRDENCKSIKSVRKSRVPLSNITSSAGNTPTKLAIRKGENIIKIQQTGENSPITPVNRKFNRAQWDNDTTVII